MLLINAINNIIMLKIDRLTIAFFSLKMNIRHVSDSCW